MAPEMKHVYGDYTLSSVFIPDMGLSSVKRRHSMAGSPHSLIDIKTALGTQAARTARALIKERSRAYAGSPLLLEAVWPGLSSAAPETMIAIANYLIACEEASPRRWMGFGGEVPLLNAKAVLLLARARRMALAKWHSEAASKD
jgi:hypothetical protein